MTAPSPASANSLKEAAIRHVLATTLDTLPMDPQRDPDAIKAQYEATAAALIALAPRDATEAMLAAQAIAAHHAAMECFRCAAQPDVSDGMGLRYLGKALALSRMAMATIQLLEQRHVVAPGIRPDVPAIEAAPIEAVPIKAAVEAQPKAPASKSVGQHPTPSERQPAPSHPTAGQPAKASPLDAPPRIKAQTAHPGSPSAVMWTPQRVSGRAALLASVCFPEMPAAD